MLKCDLAILAQALQQLVVIHLSIPFNNTLSFAKDDHQYYNAKYYVDKDFGWLIREIILSKTIFMNFIKNIFK